MNEEQRREQKTEAGNTKGGCGLGKDTEHAGRKINTEGH